MILIQACREPHLARPDIKHREHILQERMPQHARAAGPHGRDARHALPQLVDDHVLRVDEEGLEADLDAELRDRRVAVYDVVSRVHPVVGRGLEEVVDGVGGGGGEVDDCGAGVDDDLDF